MKKILLIEDEVGVLLTNQEFLEESGYTVSAAENLADAQMKMVQEKFDLIVSDIMLPDGSGLELCKEIRRGQAVPILFLSCLSTKQNIIDGLRAGGDDYMTKPYHLDELLARCECLLRRVELDKADAPTKIQVKSLTLDLQTQKAFVSGVDLTLKPKEFGLLLFFVKNPNRQFTADELYRAVWGAPDNEDVRTIKAHIYKIRKKLEGGKSEYKIGLASRKFYVWHILD